jgi:hypothetical protein
MTPRTKSHHERVLDYIGKHTESLSLVAGGLLPPSLKFEYIEGEKCVKRRERRIYLCSNKFFQMGKGGLSVVSPSKKGSPSKLGSIMDEQKRKVGLFLSPSPHL